MNTVLIRIPLDEVPVWLRILTVIVLAILVIIRIVLVIEQAKKVKSQKETDALVSHMNKNTNQIKKLSGEKEEPQSQDQEMIDQAFGKGANISGVSDEGSEEETEDNLDHYDKNKNIADLIDEISDTDASSSADITNIHKAFKHD